MMKRIRQWLLKRKFRKAILSMEKTLEETQEFYEFCKTNAEVLSENYEIDFDKFKRAINVTSNGIAELDRMYAKYKSKAI